MAPLVLESSFMAKGSVMSCKERLSPLGGWITVPRVTWLYSMFLHGMWAWGEGRGGISRRVPTVCLTSWYLTIYVECTKMDLTIESASDAKSYGFRVVQVLCITLSALKHRGQQQAVSPQLRISSLSALAKQGDSLCFLFCFFKPSCSSNSEGVGKPF